MLFNRHTLAGDGALIQKRIALCDLAVHRHGLAAAHDHQVAHVHVLDRDGNLLPAAQHVRGLRPQIHQRGNGLAGLALGARFKILAERHERQDHARGLEVQVVHKAVHQFGIACRACVADLEQGVNAVHQRRARADRDQGIHGRRKVEQRLKTVDIIFPVNDADWQRKQQLDQCKRKSVLRAADKARQRQVEHRPHGEIHQNNEEHRGYDDAGLHLTQLAVLLQTFRRCCGLLFAVVHRSRIAAGLDSLDDLAGVARALIVLHDHTAREQVDLHLAHARHCRDAFFHMRRAGRAAHAADAESLFHIFSPYPNPSPGEGVCSYLVYGSGRILSSVFLHPFSAGQDTALRHPPALRPIRLIFRRRMQKNPRCNR